MVLLASVVTVAVASPRLETVTFDHTERSLMLPIRHDLPRLKFLDDATIVVGSGFDLDEPNERLARVLQCDY